MKQKAVLRTYKMKPMTPELREKVALSYRESLNLIERELHCPHCGYYISSLYSDSAGHFKLSCDNCKAETVFNMGYFRRWRSHRGEISSNPKLKN